MFNPDNPIDQLALSGARLQEKLPSTSTEKIADLLHALAYPELYEIVDYKLQRIQKSKN